MCTHKLGLGVSLAKTKKSNILTITDLHLRLGKVSFMGPRISTISTKTTTTTPTPTTTTTRQLKWVVTHLQ